MTVELPSVLESPPRSTGNSQQDFPMLVDWFWKAYQIINQSVAYIGQQIEAGDLDVSALPDPSTATTASAQTIANLAYALADRADERHDDNIDGTATISDTDDSATVTFDDAQPDTDYTVMIQPKSISGSPADGAFTITTKTYGTADFSFTILAAPGAGTAVTYDWQLVRNTV